MKPDKAATPAERELRRLDISIAVLEQRIEDLKRQRENLKRRATSCPTRRK